MKLIAEIIGCLAVLSSFIMFQQTERKRLIFCKLIIDFLWITHLAILGAYTGVCITAIAVFRELIFINQDKAIFKNQCWLWLFIAFYVVTPIFTWQGISSILPAMSSIANTVGFWLKSVKKMKCVSIFSSASQLAYGILINSYSVMANETVIIISILISLIRKREKNG